MSRGLRNNNPGNIRLSGTIYQGETTPSTDRAFKQFRTIAYGYRAMFMLLHTYAIKHQCNTIEKMINRYAPPIENNTNGYISRVCTDAHISKDTRITTTNCDVMVPIVAAMSTVENGTPAITSDVEAGWTLFVSSIK